MDKSSISGQLLGKKIQSYIATEKEKDFSYVGVNVGKRMLYALIILKMVGLYAA